MCPLPGASDVQIRPFEPQDLPTVIELLRGGMLEIDGIIALSDKVAYVEKFVQESAKGDLADIHATYVVPGGNFWVATVPDKSDSSQRVVAGMVALEFKGEGKGELRRMAVSGSHQRLGIGRRLITHLESWAKSQGFTSIFLATGAVVVKAQAFYKANGYIETNRFLVSEEPRIEVVRFEKQL